MTAQMITNIILAVLGANAIFEFLKFMIERADKKKTSPERLILREIAAERLAVMLREWKNGKNRKASRWEAIDNMFTGYTQLNGNGEIRKLYEECQEIPSQE